MSSHIDFYFDIISPYAYIAHKKIQKIKDIKFIYKPILLGGLHNLAGITAPAFNKYKMKNMQNDCELVSKKNQIDFKWNLKFPINSLSYHERLFICIDKDKKKIIKYFF
jgi:2-hydroxychromene-2-carboxylate isomerase